MPMTLSMLVGQFCRWFHMTPNHAVDSECIACITGILTATLRPSGYEPDGSQMLVIILPTRSAAASTSLSWTCA